MGFGSYLGSVPSTCYCPHSNCATVVMMMPLGRRINVYRCQWVPVYTDPQPHRSQACWRNVGLSAVPSSVKGASTLYRRLDPELRQRKQKTTPTIFYQETWVLLNNLLKAAGQKHRLSPVWGFLNSGPVFWQEYHSFTCKTKWGLRNLIQTFEN